MSLQYFSITEHDEAGNLLTTYVHSNTIIEQREDGYSIKNGETKGVSRVDVVKPENPRSHWQQILDVFLPAGYPQSVTDDYLKYQIYDSLQAFSSSIAGLISSRAVLEGVGVGDSTASPTAALLLSILQDSMGRIATIVFAHRFGTAFEPECKMYRLSADIFNDAAMILDCVSPAFPKAARVGVYGASSVLRALCGVAAGSSKASLSAHFATKGNIAELNAKDSSQETVISLLGMLAGSLIVPRIVSPLASWVTLLFLLTVHLSMNYMAVRSVSMRSLNRQRANIVFSALFGSGQFLTPRQVSRRERIFERDGILRWGIDEEVVGHCKIGVRFSTLLLSAQASQHPTTGSIRCVQMDVAQLLHIFRHERYVLWFNRKTKMAMIVLKQGATATDQLKAWAHALVIAHSELRETSATTQEVSYTAMLGTLEWTLRDVSKTFGDEACMIVLTEAGWDLDVATLQTISGSRIVDDGNGSQDVKDLGGETTGRAEL